MTCFLPIIKNRQEIGNLVIDIVWIKNDNINKKVNVFLSYFFVKFNTYIYDK